MNIALGLLALAVAPGEAHNSTPAPAAMQADYRMTVLDMDGVVWRGKFHEVLTPTTRSNAPKAWTIDSGSVDGLVRSGETVRTTKIATSPGRSLLSSDCNVSEFTNRYFVSRMTRVGDAAPGLATALAYRPEIDRLECGWKVAIDGRPIDQGVIAKVIIEQNELVAMHTVLNSEKLKSGQKLGASSQVPELDSRRVEGEWLIPDGSALVASMGLRTVADEKGRAVTRERIVLIQADRTEAPAVNLKAAAAVATIFHPVVPAPIVAMPALPSRSLPDAVGTDGKPFPLPPLPPEPAIEVASDESSEARPSPQAPRVAAKASNETVPRDRDDEAARAEYKLGPNGLFVKMEKVAVQPLKPNIFRIPIGANLAIEIRTSVVANPAKEGCDSATCK